MSPHQVTVRSGSAITVLNAIRSDHGAAMGTSLFSTVQVVRDDHLRFEVPGGIKDPSLLQECVSTFSEHFGVSVDCVCVRSSMVLPPARGLKTSSAISTALMAALGLFFDTPLSTEEVIRLSAEASIRAGVSITGAYDDAYASYCGGFVITHTPTGRLVKRTELDKSEQVFLLVPKDVNPKDEVEERLRGIDGSLLKEAFRAAQAGDVRTAIERNTHAYAPFLGDADLIDKLRAFAEVVGLNGAGPSLFLMSPKVSPEVVRKTAPKYDVIPANLR